MTDEQTAAASPARDDDRAIVFRGVSKSYRSYRRPVDRVLRLLFGRTTGAVSEIRALDAVDLEIRRGETFGLVGRNGSGKSTLLRILSGITRADRGSVEVRGRVAPLLALGAGFNPDFSGRENVFLNAALLGMTRRETEARLPAIEAFAEIGAAIDRPVRTYSSGMFARLAFAVAVSGDPEILVVDEALSVGDAAFTRKCFARIEEIRARGSTILFVSHSVNLVLELCDRAALLESGRVAMVGTPREVVRRYQASIHKGAAGHAAGASAGGHSAKGDADAREAGTGAAGAAARDADADADFDDSLAEGAFDASLRAPDALAYTPDGACIESLLVEDRRGRSVNRLRFGGRYRLRVRVRFERDAEAVTIGFSVRNAAGVVLAGLVHPVPHEALSVSAGDEVELIAPIEARLLAGTYFLTSGVRSQIEEEFMHRLVDAVAIAIEPDPSVRRAGYAAIDSGPAEVRFLRAARGGGNGATLAE
jgi:lipopolysaccharide transport system ATP-binding protein